jgi:Domain of unknown function (DUF4262)
MTDTAWLDEYYQQCREKIAVHGHIVQHVGGGNGKWAWSYTVGLTAKLGYEIATVGLPSEWTGSILNDLAVRLAREDIKDGVDMCDYANVPLRLKTVSVCDTTTGRNCNEAIAVALRLGYTPTTIRQVIWPDEQGYFPDDVNYNHPCPQALASQLLN